MRFLKYSFGFSLIEILITLTIIIIITSFSIPTINYFWQKSTATAYKNALLHAITLTKRNAFMMGVHTRICASADADTCGGQWQNGFIVLANNKLIFSYQNFSATGVLHWRGFPYKQTQIDFNPMLQPIWQDGTFWYCAKTMTHPVWALTVNKFGRVRTVQADKWGSMIDAHGQALLC